MKIHALFLRKHSQLCSLKPFEHIHEEYQQKFCHADSKRNLYAEASYLSP